MRPDWYLYYRLLHALRGQQNITARLELQDVLVDLQRKAGQHWDVSDEQIQNFFEHLAENPRTLTQVEVLDLVLMEPWA